MVKAERKPNCVYYCCSSHFVLYLVSTDDFKFISVVFSFMFQSKKGDVSKPKPKRAVGGLLPPPPGPGSVRFPTPPTNQNFPSAPSAVKPAPNAVQTSRSISPANVSNSGTSNVDLLLDLGPSDTSSASPLAPLQSQTQNLPDLWGDFTGASSNRSITNLK